MKKNLLLIYFISFLIMPSCFNKEDNPEPIDENTDTIAEMKLLIPDDGKIYHAAFPDFGGTEDHVSKERITQFEQLAGKTITWAYFSNNWTTEKGIHFPTEAVNTINSLGRVPFIRMEPRSNFNEGGPDPLYTMDNFLSGRFDNDLKQWAIAAKNTKIPLLVEFGTEVNGDWFPWNASYNGADNKNYGNTNLYDGMEKFRDVYRRIIDICNKEGAKNITWFYHVDAYSSPETDWNNMTGYYPGDDYIDWIGISVYGPQSKGDGWWSFEDALNDAWEELNAISKSGKPIAVLEWGVIDYKDIGDKAEWITNAMKSVTKGGTFYPNIKAVSYWHENFDETNLRIDSSPEALNAYKNTVKDIIFISQPIFSNE